MTCGRCGRGALAAASGTKELAFWSKASASTSFSGELANRHLRQAGCTLIRQSCGCGGWNREGYLEHFLLHIRQLQPAHLGVGAGSHMLRLEFINDQATNSCDRNAYLDYVVLTTKDATTPPPTPPPPSAADNPFANEKFYVNPNPTHAVRQISGTQGPLHVQQMEKIAGVEISSLLRVDPERPRRHTCSC